MSDELGVRRHDAAVDLGDMSPRPESADMSAHSMGLDSTHRFFHQSVHAFDGVSRIF